MSCVLQTQNDIHSGAQDMVPTSKALHISLDDNPNMIVYLKMEKILKKMQDEEAGVPVRNVKSFMNKIPSVFTGADLITWLLVSSDLDFADVNEALMFANRMASTGYFFPIDDHVLQVTTPQTKNGHKIGTYHLACNFLALCPRTQENCLNF